MCQWHFSKARTTMKKTTPSDQLLDNRESVNNRRQGEHRLWSPIARLELSSCHSYEVCHCGWVPGLAPSFPTQKVESYCIVRLCCLVTKPCPSLCDPRSYSPLGPSVHAISQAKILEWAAISLLQGIFLIQGSKLCLLPCRQILYHWTAWETHHEVYEG